MDGIDRAALEVGHGIRRIDGDSENPEILDLALRREAGIGMLLARRGEEDEGNGGGQRVQNDTLTPTAALNGMPWKVDCCW